MFKPQKVKEVEVQFTSMLDMAFQILAFFIMTYNPMPLEGQFAMNLLPNQPQVDMQQAPSESDEPPDPDVPVSLRTLTTTLLATPAGTLGRATVGDLEVRTMDELRGTLKTILSNQELPFDQALILADRDLKYAELIKVVDIYMNLGISKISFGEAGGPAL